MPSNGHKLLMPEDHKAKTKICYIILTRVIDNELLPDYREERELLLDHGQKVPRLSRGTCEGLGKVIDFPLSTSICVTTLNGQL